MFEKLPETLDNFSSAVLSESVNALKYNNYSDNFDFERFGFDGIDRSKEFQADRHGFYIKWFIQNAESIYKAFCILNDNKSKKIFLHLIAFRLAGHLSVKLPLSFRDNKTNYDEYKNIEKSEPSELPVTGLFGGLKHFDFEYDGHHYIVDCLNLEYYLFRKQYFYREAGISISPEIGDVVVDGGACLGDSAIVFSNAVGPTGRVYAFDPVAEHVQVLNFNKQQSPHSNMVVVPFGISDKDEICDPLILDQYSPGFHISDQKVPLRTLDAMVNKDEIERIDFIKLDIEGSELAALRGAEASIRKFRPKLAVSLYHRDNDIFEIIMYMKHNYDFYDFYLDHYSIHQEETVLYCRPKKDIPQAAEIDVPVAEPKKGFWKTFLQGLSGEQSAT